MKNNQKNNQPNRGNKHILFKKEIPKFRIELPVVMEATLYLSNIEEDKVNLASLLNDIRELDANDNIKVIINSPGGYVSEGRAIINTLLTTGADIQTELVSQAASMAAIIFCIGGRRIIYENSSIMFHNFSGGIGGKGHEMKDYIKHITKNLEQFFRSHIIGLTEDEIKQMFEGKDFWFDAKEMCKRGIATHVMVQGLPIPAKQYLKALKLTKKLAKKDGMKIKTLEEAAIYGYESIDALIEDHEKTMQKISEEISKIVSEHEFLYN